MTLLQSGGEQDRRSGNTLLQTNEKHVRYLTKTKKKIKEKKQIKYAL